MSRTIKNGVFQAGHSFKCPECRKTFESGSSFVVYSGPGVESNTHTADGWWSCLSCAGIYADLASRPAKA